MPDGERDASTIRLECVRLATGKRGPQFLDEDSTTLLVSRAKAFYEFVMANPAQLPAASPDRTQQRHE
jgi:hypothetical protein